MEKSKHKNRLKINSLGRLVKFFDTHDMGDYFDAMPEVKFEVDIKRKAHLFSIDISIADKLTAIAESKKIPSGYLINKWLKEKIQEASVA
ncbi:MAG: CopG family antitoxin [bacterium]